ncbi:DUF6612 family protein [Aureibacillus halotolerans]|uniref:Sporulation and spore germination protein n=1 Tax=Aureibacillus halotolerans TaxID=1508390 RepID=A0A4R6U6I3_9BACI|nr:DUF6612 family protein [Aureibacillus halotolerans]TDQ40299.1 hypothetical protein EV213_10615 [Aureibacillus halotolerans]
MRKKLWTYITFTLLIMLTLSACSTNMDNTQEQEQKDEPTATSIINQSIDEFNALKSLHIDVSSNQTVTFAVDSQTQNQTIDSSLAIDLVQQPDTAFHIEQNTEYPEVAEGVASETYFSDQGMFTYDPIQQAWIQIPEENYEHTLSLYKIQYNLSDELSWFTDQLTESAFLLTEKEDTFIVSFDMPEDKKKAFIERFLKHSMPADSVGNLGINYEELEVTSFTYKLTLATDTLQPQTRQMAFDISSGEDLALQHELLATYSSFGDIDSIVIPDDVIKTAQPVNSFPAS